MNKKKIILLIFCLAIILGGIKYYFSSKPASPEAVWVEASKVKDISLPLEANAIGTLVARSVEITPEVAGQVEKIYFHDGSFVKQGEPLIQLDDAVPRAKYQSAKAQLTYSENNSKRMSLLGKQGAIAKQTIDQADADLKQKTAAAEEAAVMVHKMQLIAPFDGMVGESRVNRGDYVTIGQHLVTLTDTKHLRVEYNIPDEYLSLLKLGQVVSITTSAYPQKIFSGKLSFISPTINTDNRSIALYADLPNDDNSLAAGLFVNVIHSLDNKAHALIIPARSLVPTLEGEQVYKIVDKKAYAVNVSVGKREKDFVQILQGLSRDDVVITDGQLKLKNGVSVEISKHS